MASRIKGITVEICGDTTGLDKALESVNSSIKTTQSSLRDVNKLLKPDPTNTELLTQKQKLLKEAIGTTKKKLDALKSAQEQAKSQMENGDLGADKYDALQREIIETEQELQKLAQEAVNRNACTPIENPALTAYSLHISIFQIFRKFFYCRRHLLPIFHCQNNFSIIWCLK